MKVDTASLLHEMMRGLEGGCCDSPNSASLYDNMDCFLYQPNTHKIQTNQSRSSINLYRKEVWTWDCDGVAVRSGM